MDVVSGRTRYGWINLGVGMLLLVEQYMGGLTLVWGCCYWYNMIWVDSLWCGDVTGRTRYGWIDFGVGMLLLV